MDYLEKEIKNTTTRKITYLSFYTAFAVTLFLVEQLIPKPMPFMKLGLANIVVLILISNKHFKNALIVILAKSILGGLFSGTLLSPTTLMSLSGSISAICFMMVVIQSKINFSIIGISVIGAVSHNLAQLVIVRLILIKENQIFYLTPLLIFTGIATGIIIGYLALLISNNLKKNKIKVFD